MDPFLGEIRLMGCTFAPRGWAFCQGQLLPINQNQALYALLGVTYGGDGRTNFGLPDLRGRVALGFGQGLGLQNYPIGQKAGTEGVVLTTDQMPAHTHSLSGTLNVAAVADSSDPSAPNFPATSGANQYTPGAGNANLGASALAGNTDQVGSGQPHENRQPVAALNYCIALQGVFPPRQ